MKKIIYKNIESITFEKLWGLITINYTNNIEIELINKTEKDYDKLLKKIKKLTKGD